MEKIVLQYSENGNLVPPQNVQVEAGGSVDSPEPRCTAKVCCVYSKGQSTHRTLAFEVSIQFSAPAQTYTGGKKMKRTLAFDGMMELPKEMPENISVDTESFCSPEEVKDKKTRKPFLEDKWALERFAEHIFKGFTFIRLKMPKKGLVVLVSVKIVLPPDREFRVKDFTLNGEER